MPLEENRKSIAVLIALGSVFAFAGYHVGKFLAVTL